MKLLILTGIAIAALCACSATPDAPRVATAPAVVVAGEASVPAATPAAAQADVAPVAADLAAKLPCVSVETLPAQMFARETVLCHLDEWQTILVATFDTNVARDQYLELGKAAQPGLVAVKGDLWTAGGTKAPLEALAPLGGATI